MTRTRFPAAPRDEVTRLIEEGDVSGLAEIDQIDGVSADLARMLDSSGTALDRRLETLADLLRRPGPIDQPPGEATDAGEIAERILSQSKYLRATESSFDRLWAQFTEWLSTLIARITNALGGSVSAGLIALAVVAIAGLVAFTFLARRRAAVTTRHLTLERILEEGGDPDEFDRLSSESAARGDFGTAIRQAFLAGLLRLDLAERITFRPGLTTGAIVDELDDPTFEALAHVFEDIAYGGRSGDVTAYQQTLDGWSAILEAGVPA